MSHKVTWRPHLWRQRTGDLVALLLLDFGFENGTIWLYRLPP